MARRGKYKDACHKKTLDGNTLHSIILQILQGSTRLFKTPLRPVEQLDMGAELGAYHHGCASD